MSDRQSCQVPFVASLPTVGYERGDRVGILLTTYNGERFLREQLNSIARQSHPNWVVYASDDGSSDDTLEILHQYQKCWGEDRLIILRGPQQGFAKNFMSLITNTTIRADYCAFCDQDDIWFADKLERTLAVLAEMSSSIPSMYCSRTRLIDEHGKIIGLSIINKKVPCFRNALVHSIAGANTMVLNEAARKLLMSVSPGAVVVSHDWLTYLLVTGCGGTVFYDPRPTLDYRQHGYNLVGSNSSFYGRLSRAGRMLAGTFRVWNQNNLEALEPLIPLLTHQNREVLALFQHAREQRCFARMRLLARTGIHHQTRVGNAGLFTAAMLGKM